MINYVAIYQRFGWPLDQKTFRALNKKVLLCGDVELNAGPVGNESCRTVKERLYSGIGLSMSLLTFRLRALGLNPLDVGGGGDCFFF